MPNAPVPVEQLTQQTAPPRVSLLTAAEILQTLTGTTSTAGGADEPTSAPASARDEWARSGGYAYQSVPCSTEDNLSAICDPAGSPEAVRMGGSVQAIPYFARVGVTCALGSGEEILAGLLPAGRRLLAIEQHRQLGGQFWRGDFARAHEADYYDGAEPSYLTNPNTLSVEPIVGSGSGVEPVAALAYIERQLDGVGDVPGCSGRGVIHAAAEVVLAWETLDLVYEDGNLTRTRRSKTPVITGPGYDGSGPGYDLPEAATAGTSWVYATGVPEVHLGQVVKLDSEENLATIAPATNDRTVWLRRAAAASWDGCCHLAVLVDLPFTLPTT